MRYTAVMSPFSTQDKLLIVAAVVQGIMANPGLCSGEIMPDAIAEDAVKIANLVLLRVQKEMNV